jgi:hypothetical protein
VQNSVVTQSLIALLVAALVVFRFAARELKPRVVKASTLWLRPGLLIVLTAWLIWTTLAIDPAGTTELAIAVIVGALAGLVTGVLIVRYTAFSPAGVPNAVTASGSKVTFGIWIAAFVLRFAARYLVPHGADPRTQLPMNSGTLALVAVAFVVIAIAFQREIGRFSTRAA